MNKKEFRKQILEHFKAIDELVKEYCDGHRENYLELTIMDDRYSINNRYWVETSRHKNINENFKREWSVEEDIYWADYEDDWEVVE